MTTPTPSEWAWARAALEGGQSARAVAARLGVSHTTVGRRARREGWADEGGAGGAAGAWREAVHPEGPAEEAEQAARTDDVAQHLAGVEAPALNLTNPAHQRALMAAATGQRTGQAALDHLEQLAADQHQERAERSGYRGAAWLWRASF